MGKSGVDLVLTSEGGFLAHILSAFLASVSPERRKEFEKLTDDREKVSFIHSLPFFSDRGLDLKAAADKTWKGKDADRAREAREAGNAAFKSGKLLQAQLLYSVSALHAPVKERSRPIELRNASTVSWLKDRDRLEEKTEEEEEEDRDAFEGDRFIESSLDLSLALSNRSACLHKSGFYRRAVQDIQQAIHCGYPREKRFKILERKAQCLAELAKLQKSPWCRTRLRSEALEAYKSSLEAMATGLKGEKAASFVRGVKEAIQKLEGSEDEEAMAVTLVDQKSEVVKKNQILQDCHLMKISDPHPKFPCALNCFKVVHEVGRGRHVLATRDVPAGSTLLLEEAAASAATTSAAGVAGSHCHHCLALVQACVPCVWCSQVNFCSAFCRDAACSSYHAEGAECRLSELLLKEAGVNENAAKAFRLVTRFGLSHLRKCLLDDDNQIISPDPTWGAEKGDDGSGFVYESLDLINAFHHFGAASDDDDGDAELVLSAVAVFLVECLRQLTKYFPGKCDEAWGDHEAFVSAVLLHLLRVMPANSHNIGTLSLAKQGTIKGSQMTTLGGGLYNTLSLFNHSCDPCFMRANVGNAVLCITVREIKAGEEITENYGLSYAKDPLEFRRRICRRHYGFECACAACIGDWPDRADVRDRHSCKQAAAATENAASLLSGSAGWDRGVEEMRRCLRLLDSLVGRDAPSHQRLLLQNAVWERMWAAVGNKKYTKP